MGRAGKEGKGQEKGRRERRRGEEWRRERRRWRGKKEREGSWGRRERKEEGKRRGRAVGVGGEGEEGPGARWGAAAGQGIEGPEHMQRRRVRCTHPLGAVRVQLSGTGLLSAVLSSPVSPAVRGLIFFSSRAEKAQHHIRQHTAAYSPSPRNPITGQRRYNSLPSPPFEKVGRLGAARPAR